MGKSEMRLHILGCGSAMPSMRHNPSCQVMEHRGTLYMIDCGEGSQREFRRRKLKYSRLRHIFISHLHGDHCLGLPGLLSSMALQEEGGHVTVHIFAEGADLFRHALQVMCHQSGLTVEWDVIDPRRPGIILDEKALTVETFPLAHGVPAVGFLFREKPKPRKLRGDLVEHYGVPLWQRASLKEGADFVTEDGRVVENRHLTLDPDPSASYAYASDTAPSKAVARAVHGVDLLYHEATYDESLHAQARQRGHSTAREAAEIAALAGAKRLLIGHYSKRYDTEDLLLAQARAIFPNTIAAQEGMTLDI